MVQFFNQRKLEKGNAEKLIAKINKHEALENKLAKELYTYFREGTLIGFEKQNSLTPHDLGDISLLLAKGESDSRIRLKKVKELLNQEKDYKYFKILDLSDSLLVIKFRHKQFKNQSRLITDYLVPEDVKVEGRNFHN